MTQPPDGGADAPSSDAVPSGADPGRPVPPGASAPASAPAPDATSAATPDAPEPSVPQPAAPGAGERPVGGRGRRTVALAVVVLGTVGLAAVAALLLSRSQDAATVAAYYRPSSAPMNAARDAGRLLFSYDHRSIDEDFAAAQALTTGTFASEYERTTSTVVRPVAVENKAVVEATAVSQAIASAVPGRVVALVFVNQVTTSSVVTGQKVDQSRVRMTLVERGGDWKVSKVEAL